MRAYTTNLLGAVSALVFVGVVSAAQAQSVDINAPGSGSSDASAIADASSPSGPASSDGAAGVLTPAGWIVPVVRAQRVEDDASGNATQNPPNETVLYWADSADFYGAKDWYQVYDLANDLALPYAISRVSAYSGDLGDTNAYCGKDRYHLIELYDTHLCSGPNGTTCTPHCGNVIHAGYLGGLLVNLGPHDPGDQICGGASLPNYDFFRWFVDAGADPHIFPLYAPADGRVTVVQRMGTVIDGRFVPEPAQSSIAGLSMLYSVPSFGAQEIVGAKVPFTHFSDGEGGGSDVDRVYRMGDGPLSFGASGEGILDFEMRGRPMTECNHNGIPDVWEMLCEQRPGGGDAGCPANGCAYYRDFSTGGVVWHDPYFRSPLAAIGCESTCVPASEEFIDPCTGEPTGLLAECVDSLDCDCNSVVDFCDLHCGVLNPLSGNLCSVDFPAVCGLGTDQDANGVLDACDDCNRNGLRDGLDISSGLSVDEWFPAPGTADGVPDECCRTAAGPDLDGDGDVDLGDYHYLQACTGTVAGSAPSVAANPNWNGIACGCADTNADGQVDTGDVASLVAAMNGPN